MTIGERIKQRREELGLTQQELATRMGLTSKSTITKVEKGANNVAESKIAAYAEALHTTKNWLKGIEGAEPTFIYPDVATEITGNPDDVIIIEALHSLDSDQRQKALTLIELIKDGKL